MSGNQESESAGGSIRPSARPSIHRNRDHLFPQTYNMGRYGLDATASRKSPSSSSPREQGKDEVDNIQSKFQHTPSPLSIRRYPQKRNSLDLSSSPLTDDSGSSTMFAKSLPSNMRLNSYSSDWTYGTSNLSAESSSSLNQTGNENITASHFIRAQPHEISSRSTTNPSRGLPELQTDIHQSHSVFIGLGFLVSLIGIACAIYYGNIANRISTAVPTFNQNIYNKASFYKDLHYIGEKFNVQGDSILQLQTAISTIFERQDTGSFVFTYKSDQNGFHPENFNDFINTIASHAAKYLRNNSASVKHLVVDGSKLEMKTHSELITKYREEVAKTGVMLVKEVDEVPSALAMAFHYYCDEYNPLVKKSAIFFTLDMVKCSHNPVEQEPSHTQIEKCLKKKWNGLPQDNINPLLNRVVNTVVDVSGHTFF